MRDGQIVGTVGCPNKNWRVTAFIRPSDTRCHRDALDIPEEICFTATSSRTLLNAFLDIGPIPPKVLNAKGSNSQPTSLQGSLYVDILTCSALVTRHESWLRLVGCAIVTSSAVNLPSIGASRSTRSCGW